jgi:phosphoenolpyruvate---glycerone phosphotransferase subunit DhaL
VPPAASARATPSVDAIDAIDAAAVRAALARCEWLVGRHAAYLTRLDAVLGDGDHGDNLVIGFRAVREMLGELPADAPPGEVLRAVGHRLVATVGGASGPLYGTAFLEAGAWIGDAASVPLRELAPMFRAAADGLARRGRCAVGDKTILDALAPAAESLEQGIAASLPPAAAYGSAVRAAVRGMRSTRPLVARRGLAMRLGDRARGHLDPGAVSCVLLLRALGG